MVADGVLGKDAMVVTENANAPVALERLPELTALPVVLPGWWGSDDVRAQAGLRQSESGGASIGHRGYRADAAGAGWSITVTASPVYPGTLRAREDDEPVPGAALAVLWSPDPDRLRGSVAVDAPDDSGIAAAVTVVADGLSREEFLEVLRSLRVVGS